MYMHTIGHVTHINVHVCMRYVYYMYVLKYVRNDTEQRHTHTGIQIFKKASFDVHVYNTQCTWPTLQKASMGNGAFHSEPRETSLSRGAPCLAFLFDAAR